MPLSEDETTELDQIIGVLEDNRAKLTGRSAEFFDDTQKRYDLYGTEIRLSPKQWDWLRSLYDQHRG